MASIGHLAAGLSCKWLLPKTRQRLSAGLLLVVTASYLPDLDVVAFAFGIPYHHPFGHRGASHSVVAALVCGALLAWFFRRRERGWLYGLAAGAAWLTHPLLDMLTDGGLGVALFWPLSNERVFFPWRPLPVAPIGGGFISQSGLRVALTELVGLLPLFVLGFWPRRR